MANSYALPEDPASISWSDVDTPLYTRNSGANQKGLQAKLAALEGGEDAVVLASGVAAIHAVIFGYLRSGDHVVVADVTYEATWRLYTELLPDRYGIEATFVDASDVEAVRAAMRPTTRLVHVEAIANPTTKVTDVAAVARGRARRRRAAGGRLHVHAAAAVPPAGRRSRPGRSTRSPSTSTGTATPWAARSSARPRWSGRSRPTRRWTSAGSSRRSTPGSSSAGR